MIASCKWDYTKTLDKNFLSTIERLASFKSIENILNKDTLHPLQCVDVVRALVMKRSLVVYETGMGKTYICSAWMKALKNKDSNARFIMIVKNNQLIQTPFKIRKLTGFKILALASGGKVGLNQLMNSNLLEYDLLIVTKEGLRNPNISKLLQIYSLTATGIVLDEAHEFTNLYTAKSSSMIYSLMNMFEYRMSLTATPITQDLAQPAVLLNTLDRDLYPSVKSLVSEFKVDPQSFSYKSSVIKRTREDFGCANQYEPVSLEVQPTQEQMDCTNIRECELLCKGPGAYNTAEKVVEFVKQRSTRKGIIYVWEYDFADFLKEQLESSNIKVGVINGIITGDARKEAITKFENNEYDVVITSLKTSLDLDCDFVMFYQFTKDAVQLIGRAERGLTPKTIEVAFVFVLNTLDIIKFLRQMYFSSVVVKEMFNAKYGNLIEKFATGSALDMQSKDTLNTLREMKKSMEKETKSGNVDILEELVLAGELLEEDDLGIDFS